MIVTVLYRLPPEAEVYQPLKAWPALTGVLVGAVAVAFGLPVVVMLVLPSMVPPFVPASHLIVRLTVAPQSSHLPSLFASVWSAYS